jgi:hypothetical protein
MYGIASPTSNAISLPKNIQQQEKQERQKAVVAQSVYYLGYWLDVPRFESRQGPEHFL